MTINICDLSTEVLLYIFQFCSIQDVCKLRQSCKRFRDIISLHKIPNKCYNVLVTNQFHNSIRSRCKKVLAPFDKWRISHNWKIGQFKPSTVVKHRQNMMPWIIMDNEYLWTSYGRFLSSFKRTKNHMIIDRQPHFVIDAKYDDIVKFKIKYNMIIAGQREGILWIWSLDDEKFLVNDQNAHENDITCVDFTNHFYISGSYDECFKIWSLKENDNYDWKEPLHTVNIFDRIWSLELCPQHQNIAIGSARFNKVPALHIYDLERCKPLLLLGENFVKGAGILDLHWQNENILLSCGYDSLLRQWDLRTGVCERSWEDPHNGALYCLASDDLFTVLTGTNMYGRVVLWDQRQAEFVQMYYTTNGSSRSSPVYSLQFDSCELFTALDRYVKCLDFTDCRNQIKDYSNSSLRYVRIIS